MKKASALFVLILASVALVACGSSSNSSSTTTEAAPSNEATTGGSAGSGGGGETIDIEADPGGELAYTTKSLTAKAGNVTIDFKNPQALMHDVAVEDSSGKVIGKTELVAEASSTASLENLKPGTYTFFCTVPGHREAGMEGTMTVK
jgi:plastocyanin